MATAKQAVMSLLTEHLSYTPLTLLDDIINTINELVYRAVSAVEQGLTSAPPSSLGFSAAASQQTDGPSQARVEIENGVHQLETLLETAVDKYFDKMEIYVLRNILHIPEDVAPYAKLPHYKDLEFSSQQSTITPDTLHKLRRRMHETRRLQNALQAEAASNTSLISHLKEMLGPIQISKDTTQIPQSLAFLTTNDAPLASDTKAATSQLPALKQLLSDLRHKLDTDAVRLPQTARSDEKRDYLEGRAKDVLERQGVDVESGEGLVGRNGLNNPVAKEELKSIEAVAGALERSADDQRMEE